MPCCPDFQDAFCTEYKLLRLPFACLTPCQIWHAGGSILRRLRVVIRSGGSFVVFFCFSFPYRFCRNSCNGKCGAIDDGPARPVGPRLVREGLSRYLTFYLLSSRLDFDGHRIQTKNMRMARSTSLCDIRSSPYF